MTIKNQTMMMGVARLSLDIEEERLVQASSQTREIKLLGGLVDLDKCEEFKRKDIPSRKEYASTNGLCFACLEPGHLSRMCTKRKSL